MAALFLLLASINSSATDGPALLKTVSTSTSDHVRLLGTLVDPGVEEHAPLVLLFHQGMSNGRGEYGAIQLWLAASGYRSIAWDLRSGGALYGASNRTVADLEPAADYGYCDAAVDLQAAIEHAHKTEGADAVVLVGSSYSAALVFGAAVANPDLVRGVIAFSPASGAAMKNCRARDHLESLHIPALVMRPASEMDRKSSMKQLRIFEAGGVEFRVVENGVHGASMLLDERTEADMSWLREYVGAWLDRVLPAGAVK